MGLKLDTRTGFWAGHNLVNTRTSIPYLQKYNPSNLPTQKTKPCQLKFERSLNNESAQQSSNWCTTLFNRRELPNRVHKKCMQRKRNIVEFRTMNIPISNIRSIVNDEGIIDKTDSINNRRWILDGTPIYFGSENFTKRNSTCQKPTTNEDNNSLDNHS